MTGRATTEMAAPVYELRITLRGTRPPIWRRIGVPSDITLAELHEIIQIAMGWDDYHLHRFVLRYPGKKRGRMRAGDLLLMGMWGEMERLMPGERVFIAQNAELDMDGEDERKATLRELCPEVKSKLLYEYDFGDGWEHNIEVQKVYPPKQGVRYPICLAGKRACPPEDCGGVWGYYELLDALGDPKHARHDELAEWTGGAFDPDAFDVGEVNNMLGRWRRHPRVVRGRKRRSSKRRG